MADLEDRHWWFVARRRLIAQRLSRGLNLPASAQIMEAGCGTGGNLELLSRFGRVSGFEPNDEARLMAGRKGHFDLRPGRLPNAIPFEQGRFDLVVALDVLEHLDEDRASLGALREQLKPGGHLLVTVPAFQFLWSPHDELHHHKRRYTKAPLAAMMEASGFGLTSTTYFNTFLFPAIVGIRLLKRMLGREEADDAMPSPGINALLRRIFASEGYILPFVSLPFGVSLMALAQRRD